MKNVLILHISEYGGHSRAARNIKDALSKHSQEVNAEAINIFGHFYPLTEKIVDALYASVIRYIPRLWGSIYDRKPIVKNLAPGRRFISSVTFKKIGVLIERLKPDCFVATQAFPCGLIGDYKKTFSLSTPLIAVVTDYHPHRFWIHECVDHYVVACLEAKEALIAEGVAESKIAILGIPISEQFLINTPKHKAAEDLGLNPSVPIVLLMGGGLGFGPLEFVAKELNELNDDFQLVVICGKNKKMYDWFCKHKQLFRKKILFFEYVNTIPKLMDCADLIITKAGGITVSEALAKGMAVIITDPIPGQEENNVKYLLKKKAVIVAEKRTDVPKIVQELLRDEARRKLLSGKARQIAFADSSSQITALILKSIRVKAL